MIIELLLCAFLFAELHAAGMSETQSTEEAGALTNTDDIVLRMQEYSRRYRESMQTYRNTRRYHLEYRGILKKSADMAVRMSCAPGRKQFEVQSESGSKFLRNRVLRKLLESEAEAAQGAERQKSAIAPDNYEFRLLTNEASPDHSYYVLEASPRRKAKYLFVGKIWVDSRDFAITRIEGKPAVNPSWWIKEARILQKYRKVGNFWVYDSNESISRVRIGGEAILRIHYDEYDGMAFCVDPPDLPSPGMDKSGTPK
jgi:hypothetical protein